MIEMNALVYEDTKKDYELEWIEAERALAIIQYENWVYLHRELEG